MDHNRIGNANDCRHRYGVLAAQLGDAADDFADEARFVELALAGDHQINRGEYVVEIEFVGNELEAGNEPAADRSKCAAEAASGAAAQLVLLAAMVSCGCAAVAARREDRPFSV